MEHDLLLFFPLSLSLSLSILVFRGNSAATVIKMLMLCPEAVAPSARGLIDSPTTLLARRGRGRTTLRNARTP